MATDDTIIENIDIKMKSERLYGIIQHALTPRERGNYTSALWPLRTQTSPQREVAKHLGISRSYVSRIEKKLLKN